MVSIGYKLMNMSGDFLKNIGPDMLYENAFDQGKPLLNGTPNTFKMQNIAKLLLMSSVVGSGSYLVGYGINNLANKFLPKEPTGLDNIKSLFTNPSKLLQDNKIAITLASGAAIIGGYYNLSQNKNAQGQD